MWAIDSQLLLLNFNLKYTILSILKICNQRLVNFRVLKMFHFYFFIILLTFKSIVFANDQMTPEEKQNFFHLSEGSDFFPYDWFIRMKSARERDLSGKWNLLLKDRFEERTGSLVDPNPGDYLAGTIGISAIWTNHDLKNNNALRSDKETIHDQIGKAPIIRYLEKTPSIRMIGINCAYCHTGNIQTPNKNFRIEGGQSSVSIERLLGEFVISTLAVMANYEGIMIPFLESFDYSKTDATKIAHQFKKSFFKNGKLKTKLRLLLKKLNITKEIPTYALEEEYQNIRQHLFKLAKLTYHIPENESLGNEIEKRLEFIAKIATGSRKKTIEEHGKVSLPGTAGGYGRVDAFVGASNLLLRNPKNYIKSIAPVGFPAVWGIKYKYNLHYTANTNSILYRNIGQAISGGAVILDSNLNSTINVFNLHRLENLLYKIKSPSWEKKFGEEYPIDKLKAERGKIVFEKNCLSCHRAQYNVAESPLLFNYPIIASNIINTDLNLARNIVKPILEKNKIVDTLPNAYLNMTEGIASAFFKKNNVDLAEQNSIRFITLRGKEWVRNTYNSETQLAYEARDLSGVWATAPYLHNNSVPTLWDLLQKPNKRPTDFDIGQVEFDTKKVGPTNRKYHNKPCEKSSKKDYKWDVNQCTNTRLEGNSNMGHDFGTDLLENEKWDLIEYLKILEPSYVE